METLSVLFCLLTAWSCSVRVQAQDSFGVYDEASLDVTLGTQCIKSLSSKITCHPLVTNFLNLSYRSSLGNLTLTNELCSPDCYSSLSSWFNSVTASCSGKAVDGAVANRLGGYMWAGVNETCVKDPRTKNYCNDIIANFTLVSDYTEMPQTELCHTCYIRRLAMMQSSQYSIYDEYYKAELEYVYSKCGGSGPTDIPPPLTIEEPTPAPYCVTGIRYTTKAGDTCESISIATGVSSAALYMGNQDLLKDCGAVRPGISVCIPMTCQTYRVRPSDTCTSVESALGLEFGTLRLYNPWLAFDCSNLQPATDFYGKMVCVSPQGGEFTGTASPPAATGAAPSIGDGYARDSVAPPAGVEVAQGTTLNCGRWHVVAGGETCSTICVQEGITIALFQLVNPSLGGASCTLGLRAQTAVCVGPTYQWNVTVPVTTTAPASMTEVFLFSEATGVEDIAGREA